MCVYIRVQACVQSFHVFMVRRQTAAQNRTSALDCAILDMIEKTCFIRLPTADRLDEFINLQMPCCVFHFVQLLSYEVLVLLVIMTE